MAILEVKISLGPNSISTLELECPQLLYNIIHTFRSKCCCFVAALVNSRPPGKYNLFVQCLGPPWVPTFPFPGAGPSLQMLHDISTQIYSINQVNMICYLKMWVRETEKKKALHENIFNGVSFLRLGLIVNSDELLYNQAKVRWNLFAARVTFESKLTFNLT